MIFFDIGAIEIKEISPAQFIFREIGQLIKALVERKISKNLYVIRFGKKSFIVESKLELTEGEELLLRVDALKPKVILKKISTKPRSINFYDIIKETQNSSQISSFQQLNLDLEQFDNKKFLDIIKDFFLDLKKEDLVKYLSFLKSVNCGQQDSIYLFLPFFYHARNIEFFFKKFKDKSQSSQHRYLISIKTEFSKLGPIRIFIEDTSSSINVVIGVKDASVQRLLKAQLFRLSERLRTICKGKKICADCDILPLRYINIPLYKTLEKGKFDFMA